MGNASGEQNAGAEKLQEAKLNEYNEIEINGWNIKYYKGLGTSTKTEFKEYFRKKN